MSDFEFIFALFGLLLGPSLTEVPGRLARAMRASRVAMAALVARYVVLYPIFQSGMTLHRFTVTPDLIGVPLLRPSEAAGPRNKSGVTKEE